MGLNCLESSYSKWMGYQQIAGDSFWGVGCSSLGTAGHLLIGRLLVPNAKVSLDKILKFTLLSDVFI